MQGNAAPPAPRLALYGVLAARALMAALVPLTADEAYYWLWSKHLDLGYLDHPPVIAWLIRAGTMLLGNTPLGIRAGGIVRRAAASVAPWRFRQSAVRPSRS